MTTIYMIRHGEAEGNLYRRIHGDYDSLLTDNGRVQIAHLCRRFESVPVDQVWASDRFRTVATVGAIAKSKGLLVRTDPELREINMGTWEDRPWGEKWHKEREELQRFNALDPDWHAPGGEDRVTLGHRVMRAVRRIVDGCPDGTVVIGSHGTAIQQFVAQARGLTPGQWKEHMIHGDNTAVTCLTWDGAKFELLYDSDNSHLDESCSTLANQNWWRSGAPTRDINLWYRPWDPEHEKGLYLTACRDALDGGEDEQALLRAAAALQAVTPWAVCTALDQDVPVGVIAVDEARVGQGIGTVPLYCLLPRFRGKQLGIQMLGQAISHFRPMGVDRIRLSCAEGRRARGFFMKHGFLPVEGTPLLEKYVGYEQ